VDADRAVEAITGAPFPLSLTFLRADVPLPSKVKAKISAVSAFAGGGGGGGGSKGEEAQHDKGASRRASLWDQEKRKLDEQDAQDNKKAKRRTAKFVKKASEFRRSACVWPSSSYHRSVHARARHPAMGIILRPSVCLFSRSVLCRATHFFAGMKERRWQKARSRRRPRPRSPPGPGMSAILRCEVEGQTAKVPAAFDISRVFNCLDRELSQVFSKFRKGRNQRWAEVWAVIRITVLS
jgi:hypothetical protein